jgi:hypothetical protein
MARRLIPLLTALLLGSAALLLGLTGSALRTGRLDPLDWLLPGVGALIALLLIERRRAPALAWPSVAGAWALVALPPVLLILVAASRAPWNGFLAVLITLAATAAATRWALTRAPAARWLMLAGLCLTLALGRWAALPHDAPQTRPSALPAVGVVTALPLYGPALAAAEQDDPLQGAGRMSPLWQALHRHHDLRPIDHIDAASLASVRHLLLAQPRQLAPEELVALDAWVRGGGQALILADPLLHWPDPRPLGHSHRAPLTSLLDPLLAHWGLRLEPDQYAAESDPVVRRVLADGALLQLTGASRFTATGKGEGACRLEEEGFIAICPVGKGQARLVADADWINDTLWTLDPGAPHDPAAWTSDAVSTLLTWLQPGTPRVESSGIWVVDQDRLVTGLRVALLLLLALSAARLLVTRQLSVSHARIDTKTDHRWNRSNTTLDTG